MQQLWGWSLRDDAGHPERLLTGERPEPAFLIVKPYEPDTVKAIVSQALFFDRRAKPRAKLSA